MSVVAHEHVATVAVLGASAGGMELAGFALEAAPAPRLVALAVLPPVASAEELDALLRGRGLGDVPRPLAAWVRESEAAASVDLGALRPTVDARTLRAQDEISLRFMAAVAGVPSHADTLIVVSGPRVVHVARGAGAVDFMWATLPVPTGGRVPAASGGRPVPREGPHVETLLLAAVEARMLVLESAALATVLRAPRTAELDVSPALVGALASLAPAIGLRPVVLRTSLLWEAALRLSAGAPDLAPAAREAVLVHEVLQQAGVPEVRLDPTALPLGVALAAARRVGPWRLPSGAGHA